MAGRCHVLLVCVLHSRQAHQKFGDNQPSWQYSYPQLNSLHSRAQTRSSPEVVQKEAHIQRTHLYMLVVHTVKGSKPSA